MNPTMTHPPTRSKTLIGSMALILLITLLGFAARFINLGGDSLWADEIFTLEDSQQDPSRIVSGQEIDHPFGYFLIEHYALEVWDTSEFSLRLASAWAGTATIPLIYIIGSLLAGRRVGLWAAILLAIAPFHIRYSQEARGYAIQVALAAASAACLLLALKRRQRRWWVGFGIATALSIYILYSSLVVLASQIAFVVLLALIQWLSKRWTIRQVFEAGVGLALGGLVAVGLYAPWISHAARGTAANIGPAQAYLAAWVGVLLSDWISAGYLAFGFMTDQLAAIMGVFSAIGLAYGLIRRRFDLVLWLVIGIFLPMFLITFVGVSRAPLPKYILFIMIVYLTGAAIGIDVLVQGMARAVGRLNRLAARLVPMVTAIAVLIITIPLVRDEHAYIYNDFKGIAQYLKQVARDGDVVVPMTLDLTSAFNQGSVGLGYYLPKTFSKIHMLMGESLVDPLVSDLKAAAQSQGDVWFVVLNRIRPVQFDDPNIQVVAFQGSFYVVHSKVKSQSPLENMILLYPKIIPQALTPAPQCYLWLDLARLHIELNQYDEARAAMSNFRTPCPDSIGIRHALDSYLLDHYTQTQQTNQAREIAMQMIALDSKDKAALQVLSLYDLSAMYQSNTSVVEVASSPALPIQVKRFTMPPKGDWGDALVMQTPALLSFRLKLPAEPVRFVSRVALAPESWDWGGDGSRFILRVESGNGDRSTLFDQYVSNTQPDRTWHDVDIPLDRFAGQTVTLTLQTDPGPQGDTTGDWAGWDSPRIVYALTP